LPYKEYFTDIYADVTYCFGLPHANTYVAGLLLFNIMLPYCTMVLWMYKKNAKFDADVYLFD